MTAINYLRNIEKEITTMANANYMSDDGRKIHELTSKQLNGIINTYNNLHIRELGDETIITTDHTYYQIFIKVVAGRGRCKKHMRDERINEIWNNIINELNNTK